MGFGLHVGWAIEGAIGSRFKIDASYLSPHVNMASRLEAATKQFGTSILVSEDFAKLLTPGLRRRVRQIDCVTVKVRAPQLGMLMVLPSPAEDFVLRTVGAYDPAWCLAKHGPQSSDEQLPKQPLRNSSVVAAGAPVQSLPVVMLQGSNKPMGLFTYDVSLENVRAPDEAGQQKASPHWQSAPQGRAPFLQPAVPLHCHSCAAVAVPPGNALLCTQLACWPEQRR